MTSYSIINNRKKVLNITKNNSKPMNTLIPVRKEHYFDPAPLLQYLQVHLPIKAKALPALTILQFNGGQSNPTFYLNYNGQELVLRKKPPGKLLPGAHAVDREYTIISALNKVGFPVPETLLYCSDTQVIGTEFYVTRFIRGRIFRDPALPGLMPEERKAIYLEMIRVLAKLHRYKPKDLGLENYSKVEKNFYIRQIETWSRNYKASETSKIDSMDNLIDWLPKNIPPGTSDLLTICHGDYRLENIIFHETEPKILAVLDWELSSLGHPYSDLGYNCLSYHMKKTRRSLVPALGKFDLGYYGVPSEKRLIEEYCNYWGIKTEALKGPEDKYWRFYLSFATFRLAGIGQGVYKRSLQGNASSTNAGNFGKLTILVADLGWKIANPSENMLSAPSVVEMFGFSEKCKEIQKKLVAFMEDHIYPNERLYFSQISKDPELRWKTVPPIMEELKEKAKVAGLWNLFLPSEGPKLTVFEYASLCETIGRSIIAPEAFNCGAPDTGNMEVLHLFGNKAQQEKWLKPLLEGEIRSCFAMTEPRVASSDATNIETSIMKDPTDPEYYIVNGRKWWISGAGDPRCKIAIVMGRTPNPKKPAHEQQSMILVPFDTEGVKRVRPLTVFGFDDAPGGHWELMFNNVRVHKSNLLLEEGKGFMIAQGRLGPGRIHHCMRLIGLSQRALESMCIRAANRTAFGKLLMDHGMVMSHIAQSKIEIEQARLLTLYAAKCIDNFGTKRAKKEIAVIKVAAPNMALRVIDRAIQVHGGAGLSDDFMLATAYSYARTLRIADGPDDVHEMSIAKMEMEDYIEAKL